MVYKYVSLYLRLIGVSTLSRNVTELMTAAWISSPKSSSGLCKQSWICLLMGRFVDEEDHEDVRCTCATPSSRAFPKGTPTTNDTASRFAVHCGRTPLRCNAGRLQQLTRADYTKPMPWLPSPLPSLLLPPLPQHPVLLVLWPATLHCHGHQRVLEVPRRPICARMLCQRPPFMTVPVRHAC